MTSWLGVVSRDHVARGVELGIAQINHGERGALARMSAGERMVYYSPRTSLRGGLPLQAFTALGTLVGDEVWQGDDGDFKPWRRRVAYERDVRETPLEDVRNELELTARPSWGALLRRGLVELSDHDMAVIVTAMTGRTLDSEPATPREETA